ncbi:MAG: hypothetical protein GF405_01320 [Candidatus Eisenbacteria bacterium]|nr:hypothetical protein [Candidatus Eisenbacteria bacterium]
MSQQPKTVQIPITVVDEIPVAAPAEAAPGDTVVWQAGSDTVSIWFPHEDVFESRELTNRSTGDIGVTVPDEAEDGEYRYAIFSHGKNDFVQGGSHPVMIIKKP